MDKKKYINIVITDKEIDRLEEIKKMFKIKTNNGAIRKLIEHGKL